MALTREKYKRIPALYIVGRELVLRDGTVLWMQALNPLQKDEAQQDAQAARSRLVMALKSDHGSDERTKVEAAFLEDGREAAIERLVGAKAYEHLMKAVNEIQDDPDWKERLEILKRQDELMARPPEDAERKLVEQINAEYLAEIQRRQDDERSFLMGTYKTKPDEELVDEYIELYIDRRGSEVARHEYDLTEIWFAARVCDATEKAPGEWDHANCEGHTLQAFEAKVEVRSLPEDLQTEMSAVMAGINMSVREAKNSARQGSSSGSSPLPSEVEESTPSTQDETPSEPRGTSLSLSGRP